MNRSSLVTVPLIIGDLLHHCPLVLPPRPQGQISLHRRGPIAHGCVSWLWYEHDQLLVAVVEWSRRS